ncbi:MAG: hypothetical protein ABI855_02115 [Bacteroidota bacterium]
MIKKIFLISICFLISVSDSLLAQFYQGSQQSFGKNRVQYNDFLWTFYRFKNFDTYFYLGGQELAAFVGKTADKDIEEIEKIFDNKTSGRLQFIIFNKLSDMKQTNIGIEGDELEENAGGMVKVFGNKVLIYFDGNHEHFRYEIRAGIAKVLIQQLMYGGNVRNLLQSAFLISIPSWYIDGLVSYVSTGWTVEDDNRMRDGIISNKYRRFNRMLDNEEIFAGKSMWNYTSETFGPGSVSNLLYMTRSNRNIESGYVFVIGSSLKELSANWLSYYQKLYLNTDKSRSLPKGDPLISKPRNNRIYSQVKISPDGSTIAYVTNDIGKYKVWLYDIDKKKSKRIMKGGYKSLEQKNDVSFPILAWHPSGKILAIMKEKKGKVYLDYYNVNEKKKEENKFFYFEKVLDFSYSDDGQNLVLSGVQKGQSDIYIYNVRTRTYRQITKDIYDDLNPRFVMGSKFIIFSSDRISDSLGNDNNKESPALSPSFDIFLYDNSSQSQILKRVTNTPLANEVQPIALDDSRFSYLSDQNGIYNRCNATIDSVISFIDTTEHYRYIVKTFPQTDYARNIEEHDLNYKKTKYAEVIFSEGKYRMYVNLNPAFEKTSLLSVPPPTPFYDQKNKSIAENKNPQTTIENKTPEINTGIIHLDEENQKPDSSKIDINNYVFQSEFPRKKKKIQEKAEETKKQNQDSTIIIAPPAVKKDSGEFILPKQRNYDPAFSSNYFVIQPSLQMMNETYQKFSYGSVYFNPGLSGLIKVGVNDLMNDYKITGGFQLGADLNSNSYLLSYENLKKRIDKQIVFSRQSREFQSGYYIAKLHTHEIKYILKYPFNDLTAIRGTISYRNDRTVIKSTDIIALDSSNYSENWGSAKLEYIFDNTIKRGLNLRNGVRYKIFAEAFRQIDRKKTFMSVFGIDFRSYTKIHRQIIWANRFAASTSVGDLKLIYYLGSVDNAFVSERYSAFSADNFNYSINIDPTQNYAFQTIATPMRGFIQNIRNGNSFALVNSELRIPVFQYFFHRPIRSDFVRNFQIVGFGDIGTAWTGLDPYAKDNSLNTQTIPGNPITVVLYKQIEPIVGGCGFGVRSRILGFFLKGDWGWGYSNREWTTRPVVYISLGLDF